MTLEEAHKLNQSIRILSFVDKQAERLKAAIDAEVAKERERLAKIADDYPEWTHWGETRNAAAADAAAEEIAAAIRKGSPLTFDEIRAVDHARAARRATQK